MVGVEIAPLMLDESLGEGVEPLGGAEPDETVGQILDLGAERRLVGAAHDGVDAIGPDNEVDIAKLADIVDRTVELDLHAGLTRLALQQLYQMKPAHGGEADAVNSDRLAAVDDLDILPALQLRGDGGVGFRVVLFQELKGAVGEHNAEAERRVRRVLLDDGKVGDQPATLQENGEIETGGAGTDDTNAHVITQYCFD